MARISGSRYSRSQEIRDWFDIHLRNWKKQLNYILNKAGIDVNTKIGDLDDEQQKTIRNIISEEFKIEGVLKSEVQLNIKRLMDIGCYRGFVTEKVLPVRGQHTKNNSRTRKGKRKTVANKKKATK